MQGQGYLAVFTLNCLAAIPADHKVGKPTPIQEYQALFTVGEIFTKILNKDRRKHGRFS